jgi:hypothetical protein
VSFANFPRHHGKEIVLIHHQATSLLNMRQALLVFVVFDRRGDDTKRALGVVDVDGDEALRREIICGIGAAAIEGQGQT